MDVILGRGGDQAAIREDGKYQFFGGRTTEFEKRTRVKARIVAHALEELMQESEQIMIMGHTNPDIDAIGSALGMYRLCKTLEKEVNSLKSKNQELQIQLTLTQTSIETKKSFATSTNENLKIQKRRIDHKRIYSEMFTSYRQKKFKQNSEDGRSGIGVLKQLVKQKPKSFGEGTKGIIGNKILSNIIKEFRIDLQEQKKLERKNCVDNINKNGIILNSNTPNTNSNYINMNVNNNKIKKNINNKFMKNLATKINN